MPEIPLRALVAEAIGTFALCFVGILAIHGDFFARDAGAADLATVAFAHGLAIAVMVAALAAHSGAHFNPAVTFGFVVTRRMAPARGLMYWAAQLLGAFLASLILSLLLGADIVYEATPAPGASVDLATAVILEAVVTFFLVLVIFGTAVDERAPGSVFPLAIGLTIVAGIMAIGPLTGAALNPARAFGPALAGGQWTGHAVYWLGPLLGGGAAAALQHWFFLAEAPTPAVAEHGGPTPEEQRGHA
jgi:aquaporin Z